MKKIIFACVCAVALLPVSVFAVDVTTPTEIISFGQYTEGEAIANDSQSHGETKEGAEFGGYQTGYANSRYYVSGHDVADGSAYAEVASDGFSFFYDDGRGAESHSSVVVKNAVNTQGDWSKAEFSAGVEQSTWANISGDLEYGYAWQKTSIENLGMAENNGPVSIENQTMAVGSSVVKMTSGENTRTTEVSTMGQASNTLVGGMEPNFYGEGGYGGGNTLIKGNAVAQGRFEGTIKTPTAQNSVVSGNGSVNLFNGYQENIGNVVRANVHSSSRTGGN